MNILFAILETAVWFNLIVGLLVIALRALLRSPNSRYALCLAGLGAMVVGPILLSTTARVEFGQISDRLLLQVWLAGAALLLLRAGWEFHRDAARFRAGVEAASEAWECLRRVSDRFGLPQMPRLLLGDNELAPCVWGLAKGVILMPAVLATRLSPAELEALLAHEVAHLVRHDFWVNIAQRVVEALLFFHPAVWLVSHLARLERELCCDDLALEKGGSPAVYAAAIGKAAQFSVGAMPSAAGGSVAFRLRRVLNPTRRLPFSTPPSLGLSLVLGLVFLQGLTTAIPRHPRIVFPADELPARWTVDAKYRPERQVVDLQFWEGDVRSQIVLTPPEKHGETWFALVSDTDQLRFTGRFNAQGDLVFRRDYAYSE